MALIRNDFPRLASKIHFSCASPLSLWNLSTFFNDMSLLELNLCKNLCHFNERNAPIVKIYSSSIILFLITQA